GERLFVHVADRDVRKIRVRPARDMVAVDRLDPAAGARAPGVERQLGEGDKVLGMAIDESGRGNSIDNGDAPPGKRKTQTCEIDDRGADRGPAGEPRLDRMPVGRSDVERLTGDCG